MLWIFSLMPEYLVPNQWIFYGVASHSRKSQRPILILFGFISPSHWTYLTITRPDLAYFVHVLAQFMHSLAQTTGMQQCMFLDISKALPDKAFFFPSTRTFNFGLIAIQIRPPFPSLVAPWTDILSLSSILLSPKNLKISTPSHDLLPRQNIVPWRYILWT